MPGNHYLTGMKTILFLLITFLWCTGLFAQSNGEPAPERSAAAAVGADFQTTERVVYEMYYMDTFPSFPGGQRELDKFIAMNFHMSAANIESGSSGTKCITFVIEADGSISNQKILRGYDFSQALFDLVDRMPRWVPGVKNGQPVAVNFVLQVRVHID